MKKIKSTLLWCVTLLLIVWGAYAADTIVQNINGGQTSDTAGSYGNRAMTIEDGDLKFINKDGDTNVVGDYFSGYYYDPAYGAFKVDANTSDRIRISNTLTTQCNGNYDGYRLEGYSYNTNFGFANFNYDSNIYSYICIPRDVTDDSLNTYLWWYAYSPYIGFQSLSGIELDSSVDFSDDHDSEGRFLKINGIVASEKNEELLDGQFDSDVRILGQLTKSSFRQDIHRRVYPIINALQTKNTPNPYTLSSTYLWNETWKNVSAWVKVLNNRGLYFQGTDIHIAGEDDIWWYKTLIVEWANVYIYNNIRNLDNTWLLWIIVLQKDGVGGNIYIDPSVTDVHAVMYADRSLISYDGSHELDGTSSTWSLANQLYIRGSVFSENTIWASQKPTPECPFYVASTECNSTQEAMKYDLNFLRRYILVQPVDTEGNPIWDKVPQFWAVESYIWDDSRINTESQKPGYRKYPVIIEYDPQIQQTPPPFFN